jgi:hypothetical protein
LTTEQSSALRRYRLEFETRLISSKVEHFDGFGIVDVLGARKFVEAWQTHNPIPILARHDSFPNFVLNVKIKLIVASTHTTFLTLESAKIACSLSYPHRGVLSLSRAVLSMERATSVPRRNSLDFALLTKKAVGVLLHRINSSEFVV